MVPTQGAIPEEGRYQKKVRSCLFTKSHDLLACTQTLPERTWTQNQGPSFTSLSFKPFSITISSNLNMHIREGIIRSFDDDVLPSVALGNKGMK